MYLTLQKCRQRHVFPVRYNCSMNTLDMYICLWQWSESVSVLCIQVTHSSPATAFLSEGIHGEQSTSQRSANKLWQGQGEHVVIFFWAKRVFSVVSFLRISKEADLIFTVSSVWLRISFSCLDLCKFPVSRLVYGYPALGPRPFTSRGLRKLMQWNMVC